MPHKYLFSSYVSAYKLDLDASETTIDKPVQLILVVCSRLLMTSNTPSIVYTPVLNYDGERYTDGTGYNLKLLRADETKNHTLGRLLAINVYNFILNSFSKLFIQVIRHTGTFSHY